MRKLAVAVVSVLAAVSAIASTPAAPARAAPTPATVFVLAGGGWGHGVGMSQWGAYGQAKAGRDYRAILGHYYRGTTLATGTTAPERVRVLIADGVGTVTLSSTEPIVAVDGAGKRHRLGRAVELDAKLRLPIGPKEKPKAVPGPVELEPTRGASLAYGGRAFRGTFRVLPSGSSLQLVNVVRLEAYLLGVVPVEMPKDWPLEALKAQAVAARTFAVGKSLAGRTFDLYADWRSQAYYGIGSEAPGSSQAVRETRSQILTYDGRPAQVFYFSSSGGRTLSALDVFGSDVPYLHAVEDPWDDVSPHHRWPSRLLSSAQAAKLFGLGATMADASLVPGSSGRPAVLRLTTAGGGTTELRLADVRSRLGLKSTGFTLGVLRLDRPSVAAKGKLAVLTGVTRALDGVVLERRGPGGVWSQVEQIVPSPNGAFSVRLRPERTAVYRLSAGGLAGPLVMLRVAE